MTVWLAAALAAAHPVGARAATQLSVLTLSEGHVLVDYSAEVPVEIPATPEELRAGLLLLVDGAAVPLIEASPSPPPKQGDHVWSYALHLRADVHPTGVIELQTANLPEAANFYGGDVQVDPPLRVRACSLWEDGQDHSLEWLRDPSRRTLRVEMGPPRPAWWAPFAPAPRQRAYDARVLGLLDERSTAHLTPLGLTLRALLAGALGAAVRGRARAVGSAALAVALAADAAQASWLAAALVAGAGAAGLLGRGRAPWWVAALVTAAFLAWRLT